MRTVQGKGFIGRLLSRVLHPYTLVFRGMKRRTECEVVRNVAFSEVCRMRCLECKTVWILSHRGRRRAPWNQIENRHIGATLQTLAHSFGQRDTGDSL